MDIIEIKWEYIDGPSSYAITPNPFAQNPIMKNLTQGVYHFLFRVKDNAGAYAYDTVKITVNPLLNMLPTANAGSDKIIMLPVDSVRLYGTANDPDGTVAAIKWEYVDGPSSYSITPNSFAQNPIMKT
jgi:hypothetical protein